MMVLGAKSEEYSWEFPRVHRQAEGQSELPPHSIEAEMGTIACVLQDGKLFARLIQSGVSENFFYHATLKEIFRYLCMMDAQGREISEVSFRLFLIGLNKYDLLGGDAYFYNLVNSSPSPVNLEYFLDDLKNRHIRRIAIASATNFISRARDYGTPLAKVISNANEIVCELRKESAYSGLPPILNASKLLVEPIQDPPQIVARLIEKGTIVVIGGSSKAYKTWTLLDLAVSVASGTNWLGIETKKFPVLYLNFELPLYSLKKRLLDLVEAKQIGKEIDNLTIANFRSFPTSYKEIVPKICDEICSNQYGLIVADPIYKMFAENTDENSAGDIKQLLQSLDTLATKSGAAVVFAAHYTKGNQAAKNSIDRISGSGVFARYPDTLIMMTEHQIEGAFVVETKQRNVESLKPFVVQWSHPLMKRDPMLDPLKLKRSSGRRIKYKEDDLLSLLPTSGLTATEWCQKAVDCCSMGKRTFFNLLKKIINSNKVLRENDRYFLATC